ASPHPLGELLPGVFQDDSFAQRMCAALDTVIAPVISSLDCLESYLDPGLTPLDFLNWLAGWVAVSLDQNWPEERRRALVARAGELYRWHGTVKGITDHVALYAGVVPEVDDSGGAVWSPVPNGPLPGSPTLELVVR